MPISLTIRRLAAGAFAGGLAVVSMLGCDKTTPTTGVKAERKNEPASADGAPTMQLFVMSQCPYGVQAVDAAIEAKNMLGGALKLKIDYIGDDKGGALESMHGPNEVKGDIVQLCAAKIAPDRHEAFLGCQNRDFKEVAENWSSCADEVGIPTATLGACADGGEGATLLAASFAEAAKKNASGSPTIYMNGSEYAGGRRPRDIVKAACRAHVGKKPSACENIPEPQKVPGVFLTDKRCKECGAAAELEGELKQVVEGVVIETVDYTTDKGRALYDELHGANPEFKFLPAVLLGVELKNDKDAFGALQQYLRPVGAYFEIRVRNGFDPKAEICDNGVDDDANAAVDCADAGCKEVLLCREAKAQTLDLFVMSQCPYGAQAMIAAQKVTDHFGKDLTLNVHFIGSERDGELSSMHGPPEVAEDMRERCAAAKYATDHQFMKYLACRSKDYKSTAWESCATDSGMDPKVIQACVDGEGKKLLKEDFDFAGKLGIGSSPTFLANNRREFNAVEPAEIQREFCKDNPDVAGCKNPIAADASAPAPVPAGQCN